MLWPKTNVQNNKLLMQFEKCQYLDCMAHLSKWDTEWDVVSHNAMHSTWSSIYIVINEPESQSFYSFLTHYMLELTKVSILLWRFEIKFKIPNKVALQNII